jgi:guanyl-specific ribonuclease Sa
VRVIIAGPRDLRLKVSEVKSAVDASGFKVREVVCGGASGVDEAALYFSKKHNRRIRMFHAEWERAARETGNRLAAGPIRNREMAEYADALIVIKRPGPTTKGTASMIREAKKHGLPIHVEEVAG